MRLEDQTEEAFQEDFGLTSQTSEEPKGKGYIELLVDNIVGLDNEYESFGEAFGKSFNEDELGTLKNMALSAYEGAKEFATSPIETTKDIATEISDSVSRLGAESLDGRIKRMYGVGYQDATEEQVTKAREAVIGDAITASSLVPAAKGVTTVAKAAIPGKVQADVVGQMRSLIDGDREFRTESKNPPVGLSADVVGATPGVEPNSGKVRNPLFKPENWREDSAVMYNKDLNLIASFYSPLKSTLEQMPIAKNGSKGQTILAYLNKRAPNVSSSELEFSGLKLDPNKNYTREDIDSLTKYSLSGTYAILGETRPKKSTLTSKISGTKNSMRFSKVQPQSVVDPEEAYFEITLDAERLPKDLVPGATTHHGETTLAHTRASINSAPDENYILVWELQSDPLQNIGKKYNPLENTGYGGPDVFSGIWIEEKLRDILDYNETGATPNTNLIKDVVKKSYESDVSSDNLKKFYKDKYNLDVSGKSVESVNRDAIRKTTESLDDPFEDFMDEFFTELNSKAEYYKKAEASLEKSEIPFSTNTQYVKNLIVSLAARAKKDGITKIVIPPIEEIARQREKDFEGGFEAAVKALRPTYVNAVKKAVNVLNSETKGSIKVGTRKLQYKDLTEKTGVRNVTGTELDVSNFNYNPTKERVRFAEGGMVEEDQMNRLMQEGGIADDGMTREPVTGNEIPPGSMASEVRDDIPAQLSEGEYIVPADVVRFFGVRFFEDLRSQAKQGLAEMDADGRIGGTPVDAQGIPAGEGDEELTPEEQQMLMEALGASGGGAGMAYGGMITQTPANPYPLPDMSVPVGMAEGGMPDRTQFSLGTGQTGIQQRKYINPTTKEERTINFLNDTPLGIVPEGFVPWTQELADAVKAPETETPTTATEKVEREGRDRDQQGTGTSEKSYEGWAKENYDAITSDPFSVGMRELNSIGKDVGLVGAIPGVGGVIGLANDMKTMDAISKANASLSRLDPNSTLARDLQLAIDAAAGKINSGAVKTAYELNLIGQGTQVNNAVNNVDPSKTAGRTTGRTGTAVDNSGGVNRPDSGGNRSIPGDTDSSGGVTRSGGKDQQGSAGTSAGTSAGGNKSVGGTGGGGGAQQGQAAEKDDSKSYGGQTASDRSGGRYVSGGLVSKKAPANRNKKGLAS